MAENRPVDEMTHEADEPGKLFPVQFCNSLVHISFGVYRSFSFDNFMMNFVMVNLRFFVLIRNCLFQSILNLDQISSDIINSDLQGFLQLFQNPIRSVFQTLEREFERLLINQGSIFIDSTVFRLRRL